MSRNYGLGSRNMGRAVSMLLASRANRQEMAFGTARDLQERWQLFCDWCWPLGVKKLESLSRAVVITYGLDLAARVENEELSVASAHNYLSAVNRIMALVHQDRALLVSSVNDCGIPPRDGICRTNKATTLADHNAAISLVSPHVGILLKLQRAWGLRFRESALLNARRAIDEVKRVGRITVERGSKGGQQRVVPPTADGLQVLDLAASIQGESGSMIKDATSYIEFARLAYREIAETAVNFHGERHDYAHRRYRELMHAECPVAAGVGHGLPHFRFLANALGIDPETAAYSDAT